MIQAYGPECDKLGYKRNTDPWRDCVLKLSTKDSYERYATRPTTTTCFGHRGFFRAPASDGCIWQLQQGKLAQA